jgi:hypothetical protein
VLGQHFDESGFRRLHAAQVFGDTHPANVDVPVRVAVGAPPGDELLQLAVAFGEPYLFSASNAHATGISFQLLAAAVRGNA